MFLPLSKVLTEVPPYFLFVVLDTGDIAAVDLEDHLLGAVPHPEGQPVGVNPDSTQNGDTAGGVIKGFPERVLRGNL